MLIRMFTPEDWDMFNQHSIYFEHFADDSEPLISEVTCRDMGQFNLIADGTGITFVQYTDSGLTSLQMEADPDQWDQYEAQFRLEGLTSLYEQGYFAGAVMHFEAMIKEGL